MNILIPGPEKKKKTYETLFSLLQKNIFETLLPQVLFNPFVIWLAYKW